MVGVEWSALPYQLFIQLWKDEMMNSFPRIPHSIADLKEIFISFRRQELLYAYAFNPHDATRAPLLLPFHLFISD